VISEEICQKGLEIKGEETKGAKTPSSRTKRLVKGKRSSGGRAQRIRKKISRRKERLDPLGETEGLSSLLPSEKTRAAHLYAKLHNCSLIKKLDKKRR